MVFDAPEHPGTFYERYEYIKSLVQENDFVKVVEMKKCINESFLHKELNGDCKNMACIK